MLDDIPSRGTAPAEACWRSHWAVSTTQELPPLLVALTCSGYRVVMNRMSCAWVVTVHWEFHGGEAVRWAIREQNRRDDTWVFPAEKTATA